MGVPQVVGDHLERWTNAYLLDVILTRDTWMHRMDIARATRRPPSSPRITTAASLPMSSMSGPSATGVPTGSS